MLDKNENKTQDRGLCLTGVDKMTTKKRLVLNGYYNCLHGTPNLSNVAPILCVFCKCGFQHFIFSNMRGSRPYLFGLHINFIQHIIHY